MRFSYQLNVKVSPISHIKNVIIRTIIKYNIDNIIRYCRFLLNTNKNKLTN